MPYCQTSKWSISPEYLENVFFWPKTPPGTILLSPDTPGSVEFGYQMKLTEVSLTKKNGTGLTAGGALTGMSAASACPPAVAAIKAASASAFAFSLECLWFTIAPCQLIVGPLILTAPCKAPTAGDKRSSALVVRLRMPTCTKSPYFGHAFAALLMRKRAAEQVKRSPTRDSIGAMS